MTPVIPITLYIPCYNASAFLDRVLPAVKAQTYPIARTIVIDDGSSDETAEIAERHGIEVIQHGRNRGLGAARNTGVRAANTDYVAALDADVVPRPRWLEALAANFISGDYVGASGRLHETVKDSLADRWRDAHMRQSWGAVRIENPEFLYGNNGLYLKKALIEAGLYDESCRTNGEDYMMSEKLSEMQRPFVYDPLAECDHLRSDDIESICRTFWNWQFYRETLEDRDSFKRVNKQARKRLLKKLPREDWRKRRFDLLCLDLYMYADWRLRARRQYRQRAISRPSL